MEAGRTLYDENSKNKKTSIEMNAKEGKLYNKDLIKLLFQINAIKNAEVARAFSLVERHKFIPDLQNILFAYEDTAIQLKTAKKNLKSSASQPSLIAKVLEAAQIRKGEKILEIGTGSGYQAALLSKLVGENGGTVTIDIDELLIANAKKIFKDLKIINVQCELGDGWQGCASDTDFDKIIVTAATSEISPYWIEQLKEGGTIIVPLLYRHFNILTPMMKIQKMGGELSVNIIPELEYVGFVPLLAETADMEIQANKNLLEFQHKILGYFSLNKCLKKLDKRTISFIIIETNALKDKIIKTKAFRNEIFQRCLEYGKKGRLKLNLSDTTEKIHKNYKWIFKKNYYSVSADIDPINIKGD